MDQKRVEGDELLRGVANRMNKLSGKGEVATKHQRVAARVLNPRSSIDQHGRNNDGVQPRVFENPIAYGGPREFWSTKDPLIWLAKYNITTQLTNNNNVPTAHDEDAPIITIKGVRAVEMDSIWESLLIKVPKSFLLGWKEDLVDS
ncbi:hypothetical protein Tco_1154400 [Tanacetum coccineum]